VQQRLGQQSESVLLNKLLERVNVCVCVSIYIYIYINIYKIHAYFIFVADMPGSYTQTYMQNDSHYEHMGVCMRPCCDCRQNCVAILRIIEGRETAFNGFQYQFTTGKPLKSLKLTPTYYENGSMLNQHCICFIHRYVDMEYSFLHRYINT
jgi:hypothetical protein